MAEQIVTKLWRVSPDDPSPEELQEAVAALRAGYLVAFPTETVYGLGADALNPEAVRRIFVAKGRPADNPLIVHVSSVDMARELTGCHDQLAVVERLADAFWPGPLTVVVTRTPAIPDVVTAGLHTVGLRWPAHPVAHRLIQLLGRPVAAPSANRSGRPSPTLAEHVLADLNGRIAGVIDGGPCAVGLESSVVDVTQWPPVLLRPGGVTPADLERVLGEPVEIHPNIDAAAVVESDEPVRSPGMKYVHYAPVTPVVLLEPPVDAQRVRAAAAAERSKGSRVGLLLTEETAKAGFDCPVLLLGSRAHPETIGESLFRLLRKIDDGSYDVVIVEGIEPVGVGLAVMNRLRRAATVRLTV